MIIKPLGMKFVPKPWGYELWICNSELYCGKILFIKAGHFCSFHYHKIKDEHLYVQSGKLWMTWQKDDGRLVSDLLSVNHAFYVQPGVKHQMQAIEDTTIVEFSTQHFDEDSYQVTRDLVAKHEDDGR